MQTVATVLETVKSSKAEGQPTPTDKLRLVLVFYLSSPDNAISKDDINELENALKGAGADVSAFSYVRRMREISRMIVPSAAGGTSTPVLGGGGQGGELFKGFSSLGNRVRLSSLFFSLVANVGLTQLFLTLLNSLPNASKMEGSKTSFQASRTSFPPTNFSLSPD